MEHWWPPRLAAWEHGGVAGILGHTAALGAMPAAGALLADTPGFNQPLLDMPAAELGEAFPEIRERLAEQR